MKVALFLSLIAAAAAKTVIWNGRSASLSDSMNWQGGDPTSTDPALQPSFSVFGNSEAAASSSVSIQAPPGPYAVGSKITFYGRVKIILGDGTGKTTLLMNEGGGGAAEFLPGSKLNPLDNVHMKGFDFNCHMNWRDSKEVNTYYSQPPCEGDSVIVSTTDDGSAFAVPDHISKGEPLFLATFNVPTYLQRMSLEDPDSGEDGAIAQYSDNDCNAGGGSIVAGTISVSLGSCDPDDETTTFFKTAGEQDDDECVSTCPPVGLFEDGATLEKIMDPSTGEEKLILIKYNNRNQGTVDDATITSEVGADGHTYYTVTESDGTFFEHVMESTDPGIIKKRTTTTTLTLTTTSVTATSVTTTTTATTATTTTTTKAADDVFTLMPSVEDMSDLNSKEIKELLKDIEKQVKDCEKIYGTASDDGEDKCASQRDLIDSVTTQYSAAKSKEDKEASGGSMTIIIAVVVVVVLVALIAAFIVVRKKGGNEKDLPTVSFENPMYDSQPGEVVAFDADDAEVGYDAIGGGGESSSGYMDVPAGGAPDQSTGYMDMEGEGDDDGMGGFEGEGDGGDGLYDEPAYADTGDADGAGYMDIAAGDDDDDDDDEEEEEQGEGEGEGFGGEDDEDDDDEADDV